MKDKEQQSAEEIEEQAKQDFASGFDSVNGSTSDEDAGSEKVEEGTSEAIDEADGVTESEEDEEATDEQDSGEKPDDGSEDNEDEVKVKPESEIDEQLSRRLRNLEGHIGGLKQQLKDLATAKAAAGDGPSQDQITEALADEEAMQQLVEEWPSFKPFADTLKNVSQKVDQLTQLSNNNASESFSRNEIIEETREVVALDVAHPGWQKVVKGDDFVDWLVEGGPSLNDYYRMKAYEEVAGDKADAMIETWRTTYPEWWDKKGVGVYGDSTESSIKVLNEFSEYKESKAPPSTPKPKPNKRQERLARAATPESGGSHERGESDHGAFVSGFNKTKSKSFIK